MSILAAKLPYLRLSILALVSATMLSGIVQYFPLHYGVIIPLILYLLSIALVTTNSRHISQSLLLSAQPLFILPLIIPLSLQFAPNLYAYCLYVVVFFFLSLLCHNEIAVQKKHLPNLAFFVLFLLLGAAAGAGIALFIPSLHLYPGFTFALGTVLLCFFMPPSPIISPNVPLSSRRPVAMTLLMLFFGLLVALHSATPSIAALQLPLIGKISGLYTVLYCIIAASLALTFRHHPLYFGLAAAAIIASSLILPAAYMPYRAGDTLFSFELTHEFITLICAIALFLTLQSTVLFKQKTRYGMVQVRHNVRNNTVQLFTNGVPQGFQALDAAQRAEPGNAYARSGPLGQLFAALPADHLPQQIAVIGLGVGAVAAYGKEGQSITFYEENPLIDTIARSGKFFSYLQSTPAETRTITGDARKELQQAPAHGYDLILLDPICGKHIPKHLLTLEAFELYTDKLSPRGIIALNITLSLVDLVPVIGTLACKAGLSALSELYHNPGNIPAAPQLAKGLAVLPRKADSDNMDAITKKYSQIMQSVLTVLGVTSMNENAGSDSHWIVMSPHSENLTFLAHDTRWKPLPSALTSELWTDSLWKYNTFK
jgi:spermidine synthase